MDFSPLPRRIHSPYVKFNRASNEASINHHDNLRSIDPTTHCTMSGRSHTLQRTLRRLVAQPTSTKSPSRVTRSSIRPSPIQSQALPRRYPLSSQCRAFTSSSPRLRSGDRLYHRTGVRIGIRGTSRHTFLTLYWNSHSHSDQRLCSSESVRA